MNAAVRQSKIEIYLHLVWATKNREPLLLPEQERVMLRCIAGEAVRLGCDVLAINAMPDHVHLAVKIPSRLSAAALMQQVKGVSSRFACEQIPDGESFGWQEGYRAFSVGPNQVPRVVAYVQNQKRHHEENSCHAQWEETDEEYISEK